MKNHVLRPLWVAIAFVALILLARYLIVPEISGCMVKVLPIIFTGQAMCRNGRTFRSSTAARRSVSNVIRKTGKSSLPRRMRLSSVKTVTVRAWITLKPKIPEL
jgi:hypothetical protein